MDGQREAEVGGQLARDLGPPAAAVVGAVDAAVVLLVKAVGVVGVQMHLVNALAELGRVAGVEVGAYALVAQIPCLAAIGGFESANRRDADP